MFFLRSCLRIFLGGGGKRFGAARDGINARTMNECKDRGHRLTAVSTVIIRRKTGK